MSDLAECSSFNFFRLLHRKLLCSAATLLLATTACHGGCRESSTSPERVHTWNAEDAAPPLIPEDVDWAVQGRPQELQRILELASQDVPAEHVPTILKRLINLNLPAQKYPNSLHQLGLTDACTVTIVGSGAETILAFRNKESRDLQKAVAQWNLQKSVHMRTETIHGKAFHLSWSDLPDSEYIFTVVEGEKESDTWVFVALPPRFVPSDVHAQRQALEVFAEKMYNWSLLATPKWSDRFHDLNEQKLKYFNNLSAYCTVQPTTLLQTPAPPTSSPEHIIRSHAIETQLLNELGELEISIALDTQETNLSIDIRPSVMAKSDASMTPPLGAPQGGMPNFSTLSPTGTLGIIHLAFDPQTLYSFATALLPQETQTQVSTRLSDYNDKMNFDVQNDLVNNLTGHVTAFIYGLAPDTFEHIARGPVADLLLLKHARKSVLIPFKNGVQLVEFLDISTQLFPKNFIRKGNGFNNVEYIWHDDDTVRWGLLVKDNLLIYVDSYSAYHNALAYDSTAASTLLSSNHPANIPIQAAESRFKEEDHDAGIYIDITGIQALLANDSYYSQLADWLKPYSSALLVSSPVNDGTLLHLDLQIREHSTETISDDNLKTLPYFAPSRDPIQHSLSP